MRRIAQFFDILSTFVISGSVAFIGLQWEQQGYHVAAFATLPVLGAVLFFGLVSIARRAS